MSSLDSYALLLMEKEDVENASKIQGEVDELKNYMRAVSERAYQFSKDLKVCKNCRNFKKNPDLEDVFNFIHVVHLSSLT